MSSKTYDQIQNLYSNQCFDGHIKKIDIHILLPCQRVTMGIFLFHYSYIYNKPSGPMLFISFVFLACFKVFGHISGPTRPLPVITMHAITSQIYL